MSIKINVPVLAETTNLVVGTAVEISGTIYAARDAVMPKLVKLINDNQIDGFPMNFHGAAILHSAFSPAGFGPTSSNKEEIESAIGTLSKAGVRLHMGKGALKQETIEEMEKYGSIFIVVPPISALLQDRLISMETIAFHEEGMEALHELKIDRLPGIVAASKGASLFDK